MHKSHLSSLLKHQTQKQVKYGKGNSKVNPTKGWHSKT